jgi:hypothetical protein
MAIPTQAQLFEEVDRRFAAAHPDAPQRLDPNDPNQQQWVQEWGEIRMQTLNEWTDYVFFEHFPNAGQLDPSNSADADLIEYWKDIQHQINTGEQGRFNWNGEQQAQPEPLRVIGVEQHSSGNGFVLRFNRPLRDLEEAMHVVFNADHPPVGAGLGLENDPATARLELTLAALQALPPDLANWISQVGVLTAD